jgi:hypothetical protein
MFPIKKTSKYIGIALASPILLFLLLAVLLYIPPVQDFVVGKATKYASEQTGLNIHIGKLRLGFPLDLVVKEASAVQKKDTMLDVQELRLGVQFMPLLKSRVEVDKIELTEGKVNTLDLIKSTRVKGNVGHLYLRAHGVDMKSETAMVNMALLENSKLDIAMRDSVPEDTTKSKPVNWILQVRKLDIKNTSVTYHTPGDTMSVAAQLDKTNVEDAHIDLKNKAYTAGKFNLLASLIQYDQNYELPVKGLDYNHLELSKVQVDLDSFAYKKSILDLRINTCTMNEKSGLMLSSLTGKMQLDSTSIHMPDFELKTPDSDIRAKVDMDFNAFDGKNHGKLYLDLMAEVGKQDLMFFLGSMPTAFVKAYPNRPIVVRGVIDGNMNRMNFSALQIKLESAFTLLLKGRMQNLTDFKNFAANLDLNLQTQNINFVKTLLNNNLSRSLNIPYGLGVVGKATINRKLYTGNLKLKVPHGNATVVGMFDASSMRYRVDAVANSVQIHDFLPKDSLYALTGKIHAQGQGTDILSKKSHSIIETDIRQFRYGHYDLSKTYLHAKLNNGHAIVKFNSNNPMLDCDADIDALLNHKLVNATFSLDLRRADLYRLHLTDKPFSATMCLHMDGSTNLRDRYRVLGDISDIHIITDKKVYSPKEISLDVNTTPDTTYAHIESGSLLIDANAPSSYKKVLLSAKRFTNKLLSQIKTREINESALKSYAPDVRLTINSRDDNPLYNYLSAMGYTFHDFQMNLNASPKEGLNGTAHLFGLNADSVRIDTIKLNIAQDTIDGLRVAAEIQNNKKNPQFTFDVKLNAYLNKTDTGINLAYFDDTGAEGIRFGAVADLEKEGIKLHFQPERPIIAYRNFTLNKDNFVFIGNDKRIEANIDLLADDSTGIKVYSTPNDEALQDVTVGVNHFNIGELSSVLPYLPRMGGFLHGDFHLVQTEKQLTVSADVNVKNMTYEHCPLGDISMQAVYLPQEDGSHYMDAQISQNEQEIATIAGTYRKENTGIIDAMLNLEHCPMNIANGFMPEHTASFTGFADGKFSVKGSTDRPVVNGFLYPDSVHVLSDVYGLNLRLDDHDSLRVANSSLQLNNFNIYSIGKNPLILNGGINFADFSNIRFNMRMRANDFTLVKAERSQKSLVYGTVNVNFGALMTGTADNIVIKGGMTVLGNSNFTYVLKDSPLTVEDRLSGLVTFVDFSDTTAVKKEKVSVSGVDLMLALNVEEAAQINCDLSSDRQSYVNLEGGGTLTLRSTPQGNMTLTGRYTVNSGNMKYTLPVVPLKDFTVKSGSYIEFTGDASNPILNIAATEQMKASVTEENSSRSVTFNVGVSITRTLKNMGLVFTLDAPDDLATQNELAAMSLEERGKLAVTMLATGMYLGEGGSGKMNATNALNAFLQSEISNIAGNALKTIDLSVGMESGSSSDGNTHTDYSFKFAKRFWGNRVSIIIGGKVSTDNSDNSDNSGQTFIDNVSLEYRLDKGATRYVRLFYDSNKQDILEGRLTETGGGLVLRKKIDKLSELFIFRDKKKQLMPVEPPKTGGVK